ncbi:MAG: hypothetical protein ABGX11_03655, partial [Candidatus Poseidoniia archaeon]
MADESDNSSFESRLSKVLDSIREAFEGVPTDLSGEQKLVGASDKTWVSWLIILTFWIVWG